MGVCTSGFARVLIHESARLRSAAQVLEVERTFNSLVSLLMWVKCFKYLEWSYTMSFMLKLLKGAWRVISFFFLIILIIFMGLGQQCYLAFSPYIAEYRTLWLCLVQLFRSIFTGLDYAALHEANRLIGPLFFNVYMCSVFVITLNVFVSILNDAYEENKDVLHRGRTDAAKVARGERVENPTLLAFYYVKVPAHYCSTAAPTLTTAGSPPIVSLLLLLQHT